MKIIIFAHLTIALLLSIFAANEVQASNTINVQQHFKQLQALAGKWHGQYKTGGTHQVSYRLSARGSALVETWTMSKDSESLTIYTLDNDRLLATHYCPQGNQVTLMLSDVDDENRLHFEFLEGRNLHDESGHHQTSFWVQVSDETFTRSETYAPNKNTQTATLEEGESVVYRRVK